MYIERARWGKYSVNRIVVFIEENQIDKTTRNGP